VIAAGAFDVVLALALAATGALVLMSADFLRTVVLFIAFGLLMAFAWLRLMAPDIALAEAAIGAGITGVLLVDALRHMEWGRVTSLPVRRDRLPPEGRSSLATRLAAAAAATALFAVLLAVVLQLPGPAFGMADRVRAHMDPIEQPITAVLLVFRSFDTLLELGILLLAVLGMLTIRGRRGLASVGLVPPRDPVLEHAVRLLVPVAVCVGGYMLWLGTFAAGGAFQAGVIFGAAGILLWLSGHRSIEALQPWIWQSLVLLGFVVFLTTAGVTMFRSEWALQYPRSALPVLIEVMEGAAAISIGASFVALFVGLHPSRDSFDLGGGDGR
jgi:multisubunit Na+/H+ antiporter MnhB subunit